MNSVWRSDNVRPPYAVHTLFILYSVALLYIAENEISVLVFKIKFCLSPKKLNFWIEEMLK